MRKTATWIGAFAWVGVLAAAACSQASSQPPTVASGPGGAGAGGGGDDTTDASTSGDDADEDAPLGTHLSGAGASVAIPSSGTTTNYVVKVAGTVGVSPGVEVGYALTASALKTYQLRWTGDAKVQGNGFQEFYGSVWTTGTFTSLTPGCTNAACPLEPGDFVSAIQTVSGGQRIDWDTFASTGWDGFSFTTDTEPVYLEVFIDGQAYPQLFYFPESPSGATESPAANPFGISSAD